MDEKGNKNEEFCLEEQFASIEIDTVVVIIVVDEEQDRLPAWLEEIRFKETKMSKNSKEGGRRPLSSLAT